MESLIHSSTRHWAPPVEASSCAGTALGAAGGGRHMPRARRRAACGSGCVCVGGRGAPHRAAPPSPDSQEVQPTVVAWGARTCLLWQWQRAGRGVPRTHHSRLAWARCIMHHAAQEGMGPTWDPIRTHLGPIWHPHLPSLHSSHAPYPHAPLGAPFGVTACDSQTAAGAAAHAPPPSLYAAPAHACKHACSHMGEREAMSTLETCWRACRRCTP